MLIKLDFQEFLVQNMLMQIYLRITIKNEQKWDMWMNMEKLVGKDQVILKVRNSKNKKIN